MTVEEFVLWLVEYQRAPWGPVREDLAAGIVASAIINQHADDPVSPAVVMPFLKEYRYADETETANFLKGFS